MMNERIEIEENIELEFEANPGILLFNDEEEPDTDIENLHDGQQPDDDNRLHHLAVPNYYQRILIIAAATTLGLAAFFGVGYGSGYGINELVHSNNNDAALVSSSKNKFNAYDDTKKGGKASKAKSSSSKRSYSKSGKSLLLPSQSPSSSPTQSPSSPPTQPPSSTPTQPPSTTPTQSPSSAPSQPPSPEPTIACFKSTDGDITLDGSVYSGILYDAVRDYYQNCTLANSQDCDSALTYGFPIGDWCVGAVTSMVRLFSNNNRSPVPIGGFNEDISNWDVISVENMRDM